MVVYAGVDYGQILAEAEAELGETGRVLLRPRILRVHELFAQLGQVGVNAIPVVALVTFLIGFVMIHRIIHSPFGQILKAIRDNEPRALSRRLPKVTVTPDMDYRFVAHAPANMEEFCLATIGRTLYETFIEGYTTKQWGRHPRDLPADIVKRLPVRMTHDDNYFNDRFQGIPVGGYTAMIEKMMNYYK